MMRNPRIALFLASLFIAIEPHPAQAGSLLDGLAIDVKKGSREFVYTNKQSAFYYGETNGENSSSWQGFNVQGYEFVDDYALFVNGKPLARSSVVRTVVYPDYMVRVYPNGITETLSVAEGIAVFSVQVTARTPVDLRVIPYFTDGRRTRDYDLKLTNATALIARERHLQRSARENYPVWLAIYGKGFLPLSAEATKGVQFSPLLLFADKARSHTLAFAVADQPEQAEATVKQYEQLHTTRTNMLQRQVDKIEDLRTARGLPEE